MKDVTEGAAVTNHAVTFEELQTHRDEILRLASAHGASNVRVFGSVARGEARHTSDVDLLVDFEHGRSLIDLTALIRELEALLGCSVDIGTHVHEVIRDQVEREAIPL